jgi:hypothetical protein
VKQEEYEVLLEIPEDVDPSSHRAVRETRITTKILFIWSMQEFYNDQIIKSEKSLKTYKTFLEKNEHLIESLNEPFRLGVFEDIVHGGEIIRDTSKSVLQKSKKTANSTQNTIANSVDVFIFDKTDQFVREKLSKSR